MYNKITSYARYCESQCLNSSLYYIGHAFNIEYFA
nr:MAG TPA: hypothetical protein [Caudoviricetes sp.]